MNTAETWKPIPGWPAYAASSHGRVKRILPCPMPRGRGFKPMKVLTPDRDRRGYQRVLLHRVRHKQHRLVHRLVLTTFLRPPKPHEIANHLDADVTNNHLDNLEWTTAQGNELHKMALGRTPCGDNHWSRRHPELVARGIRNGFSKLTEETVRAVRLEYMPKYGVLTKLARKYGTSVTSIWDIVNGKTWTHVI